MKELMASPYFGVALSIVAFWIGVKLNHKLKTPVCNPLIVAIVLIVGVLLVFDIPYDTYNVGGALINMFLAPATACLAVAIYTKLDILKQYWLPILVGCTAGSAASMGSVYGMCRLFGLDESMTVSLLPKSVTTPIAVSISEPGGGVVPITVVAVIFTGILGSIIAPFLIRIFRVSGGGRTGDWIMQSCGGNVQGNRARGSRRCDEWTGNRNLWNHHCTFFHADYLRNDKCGKICYTSN